MRSLPLHDRSAWIQSVPTTRLPQGDRRAGLRGGARRPLGSGLRERRRRGGGARAWRAAGEHRVPEAPCDCDSAETKGAQSRPALGLAPRPAPSAHCGPPSPPDGHWARGARDAPKARGPERESPGERGRGRARVPGARSGGAGGQGDVGPGLARRAREVQRGHPRLLQVARRISVTRGPPGCPRVRGLSEAFRLKRQGCPGPAGQSVL